MRTYIGFVIAVMCLWASGNARAHNPACKAVTYLNVDFTVCAYPVDGSVIVRTFLRGEDGEIYGDFETLDTAVTASGDTLLFAMNGGMYHEDRSPAGLYIEERQQTQNLNINKGPGNFHMLPNGVFYMNAKGAGVVQASVFALAKIDARYATQSGPMLVIDGKLHPKFNKGSTSVHVRNGVGVADGTVYFAISNQRVNFHTFASLFKDHLNVNNALYLDGNVSKIYAPDINRRDTGRAMGPIIAVVGAQ